MPERDDEALVETRVNGVVSDESHGASDEDDRRAARPVPRSQVTLGRLLRDMFLPSRAQFILAIGLCLVTMASVWQMRANKEDQTYSSLRRDELIALLGQLNRSNDDLRAQINEQENTRRTLESGAADRRVAEQEAERRLQDLGILAGTAPARGPGVTITINDVRGAVGPQLLLDAMEEMRDAGAEVMEINGIRLVASSWFGGGPGAVTVSGAPITAPYVLKVIGDPHALAEGARFRGGLVSQAERPEVGAVVTITDHDDLLIRSVHAPRPPKHSKPA